MKKPDNYGVYKISRRKFNNGWTFAEAQKIWRMYKRESKLEQWGWKQTFREFINNVYLIGGWNER